MIFITGDTHGDPARFQSPDWTDRDRGWCEQDFLIICGDFGYLFADSSRENLFLDWLEEEKPYQILFVDGNHENFHAIEKYPVECWNGGKVHRIRNNIRHLMRGQMFMLDGKSIFTMGGAYSIDRYMRVKNRSYWEEELPNNAEYREAAQNLQQNGNRADIIITHTAPREIIRRMGYYPDAHDMELTGFLEWIQYECIFGHWYFGHWHIDRDITDRFTALWQNLISV